MNVLGISAFYHDSAACLISDNKIIAAAAEERFSRIKTDKSFPKKSILFALDQARLSLDDLDAICFYDKPLLTFDRLLQTYLTFAPRGLKSFIHSMPIWLKQKLFTKENLMKELKKLKRGNLPKNKILFCAHHHSHAASAFYPSSFKEAAILVMDGVGEWATTSIGYGRGSELKLLQEIKFPHSLGLLYSAFTYYLGFQVNEGEYKVMGLAPYGNPRYVNIIKNSLIAIKPDGSYFMNMDFFDYCTGTHMTNEKFHNLFGEAPRKRKNPLEQFHMDVASSIQKITEEIVLKLAHTAHKITGSGNLCMAGGVALNCVANGRVLKEGPFKNIWIQPAASDAGGALGAALTVAYLNGVKRTINDNNADNMNHCYLGPHYTNDEILHFLLEQSIPHKFLASDSLCDFIAEKLAEGKIIGWFQGRMEWGPRALGNRSILADPRSKNMQKNLNLKIKFRESFRPFAPVVLEESRSQYFDMQNTSPYMLFVTKISEMQKIGIKNKETSHGLDKLKNIRSRIPAITHVDYTARVQTVNQKQNPLLYQLLKAFKKITGCGVLVNTSFNVRNEPIVCSPLDALQCFQKTKIDLLVLGNYLIESKK